MSSRDRSVQLDRAQSMGLSRTGGSQSASHSSTHRGSGHPALTLVAVAFGLVMATLDSTIVAVANPTIGRHFHASLMGLQWVTIAYLLALAVGLIAGGKLGDSFGRKRLFLIGTAGFAATSLACGLSAALGALIAFRGMQGLCGALMIAQTLAILRATFPLERVAAAVGMWATGSAVVAASGPIVGGVLIDGVGWRSIFLVNVPLSIISLLVGSWVIRGSHVQSDHRSLDWPGIALLSAALFTMVWGLIDAERDGWSHWRPFEWLLTAVVVLGAFAVWEAREQRLRRPRIPLGLFRSRQLSAALGMVLSAFFALFAALFYLTLYLQRVEGDTAIAAGVHLLALTGVMALGAVVAGRVVGTIGPCVPLLVGALLSAGGLVGLSRLSVHSSYSTMWPFLTLVGLGLGPVQTGASRAIVGGVPPAQAGAAGGLQATGAQIGGLLGLAVLGSVITSRVTSVLPHKLIAAGVPDRVAVQLQDTERSIAQGLVPIPKGISAASAHAISVGGLNAFTSGLDTALVIAAAVALAGGIGAFVFVRPSHGRVPAHRLSEPTAESATMDDASVLHRQRAA